MQDYFEESINQARRVANTGSYAPPSPQPAQSELRDRLHRWQAEDKQRTADLQNQLQQIIVELRASVPLTPRNSNPQPESESVVSRAAGLPASTPADVSSHADSSHAVSPHNVSPHNASSYESDSAEAGGRMLQLKEQLALRLKEMQAGTTPTEGDHYSNDDNPHQF